MALTPLERIETQDPQYPQLRQKIVNNFLIWAGVSIGALLLAGVAGVLIAIFAMAWVSINAALLIYQRNQLENFHHYRQLEALASLHQLIDITYPLPPMRLWAISPDFAAVLAGTIQREKPGVIVELGSGTSTLISAYSLQKSGGGQVIAFEHQAEFAENSRNLLAKHGISATIHHAPLATLTIGDEDDECGDEQWQWYSTEAMEAIESIDLLVVDGPPARGGAITRYPALPVLYAQLAPGALILVDDYLREGELKMVNRWLDEFDLEVVERIANEKGMIILRKTSENQNAADDTTTTSGAEELTDSNADYSSSSSEV